MAARSATNSSTGEDDTKTAAVSPDENRDALPSPETAPPSYNDLVPIDRMPGHPIGTIVGQEGATETATKSQEIKVSKTTVGVVGVLVGAALCNVM